jgi:hypothetical protein
LLLIACHGSVFAQSQGDGPEHVMHNQAGDGKPAAGAASSQAPPEHVHVKDNVMVSDDVYDVTVTPDAGMKYLGSFPFDIRGIAGGYRYIWGEGDTGKHLRRVFIVQAEGYYPTNDGYYKYGAPNPAVLAGETYQHVVFIYDNDASAEERPGNESDLTRKFLGEHGYEWEPQLIMSRFARAVGESRKNEIIFFYFENLKDYTSKQVKDFPEDAKTPEKTSILEKVDANSRKAFVVER